MEGLIFGILRYTLIGNCVSVNSSLMAPGLANARPPGSAKFANALPLGLTRRANAPQEPGGWAQLELTDELSLWTSCLLTQMCNRQAIRANVNKASKQAKRG